jgi:hypothetical protein
MTRSLVALISRFRSSTVLILKRAILCDQCRLLGTFHGLKRPDDGGKAMVLCVWSLPRGPLPVAT